MKEFNLVLTPGMEENDKIVLEFISEKYGDEMPWAFYSLPYVPPFQKNWEGIINFEKVCRYHPFSDESQEKNGYHRFKRVDLGRSNTRRLSKDFSNVSS